MNGTTPRVLSAVMEGNTEPVPSRRPSLTNGKCSVFQHEDYKRGLVKWLLCRIAMKWQDFFVRLKPKLSRLHFKKRSDLSLKIKLEIAL